VKKEEVIRETIAANNRNYLFGPCTDNTPTLSETSVKSTLQFFSFSTVLIWAQVWYEDPPAVVM
jgi:hypothetical protein